MWISHGSGSTGANCASGEHGTSGWAFDASVVCDGVMTASTLVRPANTPTPQLTAADRCDQCGARAWVRATMSSGSCLYFCAHHANRNIEAFIKQGVELLDERHLLLEDVD